MTPVNRRLGPTSGAARRPDGAPARSPDGVALAGGSSSPARPSLAGRLFEVVRTAAGVSLVISASLGLAWAARRHVLTSPRFAIVTVDVTGNDRRSSDAIVAECGLAIGANIFEADLDSARERLLHDPWMTDAVLARRLPGTLLVHVTERKAAALVALGDVFLASAEGEPFKKLELSDPIDLPLITGIRPEALGADREGTTRSIRRAIDLSAEYEQSPLSRRAPLQEVHLGADGATTLVVGHSATELVLGGPPFRRKLEQASRVVGEIDRRGGRAESIMLDNDARPERVVVRMR